MKTLKKLMDLTGKVVIVTGGAGYLGFPMAETLAEMGADIVLLDINKSQSADKAKRIEKKYNVKTLPLIIDLAKEDEVRSTADIVLEKFGRIDILVNTAALSGITPLKGWTVPFEEQSTDTWRKAMEVNVTSIFTLIQSCAKALAKSKCGSVINICSIYGIVAPDMKLYEGTDLGNPAAYSVNKGGLLQLTRWLSTVLAPDVRVNAISPGGVFRNHRDPFLSRYVARTPMGRMGSREDMKGAVAYLASDLSSYVTGQNIVVDGGWTAW